jgi:hypothetical protein
MGIVVAHDRFQHPSCDLYLVACEIARVVPGQSFRLIIRKITAHRGRNSIFIFSCFLAPLVLLLSIFLLQMLPNSCQLNVACALVNRTDLAIPEVLLCETLSDKTHAPHPFNCRTRYSSCHL